MDLVKKERLKRLLREVRRPDISRRRKLKAVRQILEQFHPADHVAELTAILYEGRIRQSSRRFVLMMLYSVATSPHIGAASATAALKKFAADVRQPRILRDDALESLALMGLLRPAIKA